MEKSELELYKAILKLESPEECELFFRDLCTPKELKDLRERWQVAKLLDLKTLSYREIKKITNVSLTTITRVARFLSQEPNQGYKLILTREGNE